MKTPRRFTLTMLAAAIIAVSAGTAGAQTASPKYGGTLKVNTLGLDTSDPHRHTGSIGVVQAYVEGLTGIASDGSVKPFLAESFSVSKDGKTYTFILRKGVIFHNGKQMTAKDVVANFTRVQKLAKGWLANAMKLVVSASEKDEHIVEVKMSAPYAPFLSLLSELWIMSPESPGWNETITLPIGTGPFKFGTWIPNVSMICPKHASYWQKGLPYLDSVVFDLGSSDKADLKLRAGDIQIGTVGADQDKIKKLQSEGFLVKYMKDSSWIFWAFNNRKPRAPFDNPKVREAISYGLDKGTILSVVAGDTGVVNTQMVGPGNFYSDPALDKTDKHRTANIEKSKAMLKELGVDPSSITIKFVTWQNEYSMIAAEMLKKLGFKINHLALDDLGTQNELGKYDWDMTTMGSGPRADIFLRYVRLMSDGPNPVLWGGIQDKELDARINKAVSTVDDAARRKAYLVAYSLIMEKYYFVVIGHYYGGLALAKNVKGFDTGFTWSPHNVDGGIAKTWLE
ncbi:MAG TPA: peptide ABC transporter substrate-binding protein [Spirochaetaceae bacterium]|nr:peptide ABC transporter substrate-binding protein [Spirochaetaceae bacterium]